MTAITRITRHATDPAIRLLHLHPDDGRRLRERASYVWWATDLRAFIVHISDLDRAVDECHTLGLHVIDETAPPPATDQPPLYDPDERAEGRPPTAEYQVMREQLRTERVEAKRRADEPAA